MIQSDWWCRFIDVKNGRSIHVYPGGCYWAFVEPGIGDAEISFARAEGDMIAAILERVIHDVNLDKQPLVHRFVDTDSNENSAFLAHRDGGNVTITFVDGLEGTEDPASKEATGMSLSISTTDAEKLLAVFRQQLQMMHD